MFLLSGIQLYVFFRHLGIGYVIFSSCYLITQVQPKHVKEAFRLLNKSIIRVETPDIQFDEQDGQGNNTLNFFAISG